MTGLSWPLLALGASLLALVLVGALTVGLLDEERAGYLTLLAVPFYALAGWRVLAQPPADQRRSLLAIIGLALAMRVVLLPGAPISNDVFRYVWDGRVQSAGVNPYLYVPADPALAHLRDQAIYPDINRADYARTIYPPMAQIVFFLVTRISESVVAMKVAMVAFEALAVWAILQLLAARALPATHVLLYLWHPLPMWEFARSGHVDAVAIAFLMLAFVAADRRSPAMAGIALAAGTLVKYFPAVAGPSLYQRWDWRLPAAFIATLALLYLPYLGAGTKVLGFLGQYVTEERLEQGSGLFFWLLLGTVVALPSTAFWYYFPAAAAIMIGLAIALMLRQRQPGADLWAAMVLAVAFLVLFSPHYAWYFAWLVPFLCFYPSAAILYLTCAANWHYVGHWPPHLSDGLLIYGGFFLVLAAERVVHRYHRREERRGDAVPA